MPSTKTKPKKNKDKKKNKKKDNGHLTAKSSDRHALYEKSVQEPEAECDLINQVWEEQRGRGCTSIREDFCGTAAVVCMEWVNRRRGQYGHRRRSGSPTVLELGSPPSSKIATDR